MELARCKVKGFNLNFLLDLQFLQYLFILFGLINLSACLFEDQIGKFDWKQNYVGKLKFSRFDTVSTAKKIILATEENVVAALSLKTGHILWRQVLEQGPRGQIHYLHVNDEVITISGNIKGPLFVRSWSLNSGVLLWEWVLPTSRAASLGNVDILWFVHDARLIQAVLTPHDGLELTSYNLRNGRQSDGSVRVNVPELIEAKQCVVSLNYLVCLTQASDKSVQIVSFDVVSRLSSNSTHLHSFKSQTFQSSSLNSVDLKTVPGPVPLVLLSSNEKRSLLRISAEGIKTISHAVNTKAVAAASSAIDYQILFQLEPVGGKLQLNAFKINENNVQFEDVTDNLNTQLLDSDEIDISSAYCGPRKDRVPLCRFVLTTDDGVVALLQNTGKILWIREESLTDIVAVDMLDLPVSDMDALLEREFDNRHNTEPFGVVTDIYDMFIRRITNQMQQLKTWLKSLKKLTSETSTTLGSETLVRDEFGLHKIIIVATAPGKLFGIDNRQGNIIWKKTLPNIQPFLSGDKKVMKLLIQRTTRHFPHKAQCVLIAKDKHSNNGITYTFNPIDGTSMDGGLKNLNFRVKQLTLLPEGDEQSLKGVLFLDNENRLHLVPKSSQPVLDKYKNTLYLFTIDYENGVLAGFDVNVEKMHSSKIWEIKFKSRGQTLVDVIAKNPIEKVHSQGRVLGDRSVLFKYINPNLVVVVTQASDPVFKGIINIYLLDVVTGAVVHSVSHKRAKLPVHVVHSENWLAYSYFNDKHRRTEITTMELYEGQTQKNSTVFSSLASPPLPFVQQQSFIFPAHVATMRETITESGITSKHILISLSSGAIVEMPWLFLDPRRPIMQTNQAVEEGVVPYIPELPVHTESYLNYNQTLHRLNGIVTVPSGLESTSLVLAYGLDLFYTRVAPSKSFDLLKDDFDYYLITIVLIVLTISTFLTRQLALRKTLKVAWK